MNGCSSIGIALPYLELGYRQVCIDGTKWVFDTSATSLFAGQVNAYMDTAASKSELIDWFAMICGILPLDLMHWCTDQLYNDLMRWCTDHVYNEQFSVREVSSGTVLKLRIVQLTTGYI